MTTTKNGKREKLQRIYDYIDSTDTSGLYTDLLDFLLQEIELVNKKNNCHKKKDVAELPF